MNNPNPMMPVASSRRRFLRLAGASLAVGAGGIAGARAIDRLSRLEQGEDVRFAVDADANPAVAGNDLVLVVIELEGGLDGFNTVVPYQGTAYHDLRGAGALNDAELIVLDDDWALNAKLPNLARRWSEGHVAFVHGVGIEDNSLSHFTSADAWSRGRVDAPDDTGWIARALSSALTEVDPLAAISIGYLSPSMIGDGWSAVALPDNGALPWSASFVESHPGIVAAYQQMLVPPRMAGEVSLGERVRNSQQLVRSVADSIGDVTDVESVMAAAELLDTPDVPADADVGDGLLPARLAMIADLIRGDLPTRAYHVIHGGFDTHASQRASLPYLLAELDTAIESFFAALGPLADRVVVATRSEFGRRPTWNGTGTDHGSAGVQMVVGPRVLGGHHGEPSPLSSFDEDGNFIVTTDFRSYLGGLALGAFGGDPEFIVPGARTTLELVA